jgi:hypothetical protein
MKLYHATSAQRLFEILNTGEIGTEEYMDNGGDSTNVFLGDDLYGAARYGYNVVHSGKDKSMPNWVVVLEINVDTNNLRPDMDDWVTIGNESGENPNPTWEESLDELGQVMHEGRIPVSQIAKVHNIIEDDMSLELNNCEILKQISFQEAIQFLKGKMGTTSTPDDFLMDWSSLGSDIENEDVDW